MRSRNRIVLLATSSLVFVSAVFAADRVASKVRTLGDTPPALNIDFLQGEPITLADGIGKGVFVIEFWATWCGPCRYTAPHLTKLQKEYGDRGLVVIGISNEDAATVRPYVEEMGEEMDYRIALDRAETTNVRYFEGFNRPSAYPTAFVIDGNGRVAWIGTPGKPIMDELIRQLVDDLPRIARERAAAQEVTSHE